MRITYIRLKNFKNIDSGQHVRNLEIDLSTQKNTVCIISGPNGSGKTSLLSYLTPFATLGNLDVRDSGGIIIDKEEGEKEIHITDNDDKYIIKHFYTPKPNAKHSVKSYISCNGIELNENGNVTSFKMIVFNKLGLDMDYLKLIRIGDNVSNLIDSKSTERKIYMGKILDVVDTYLKQHKQFASKLQDIKTIINHMMDELQKIAIKDPNETKVMIDDLKSQINVAEHTRLQQEKELARVEAEYDAIGFSRESIFQLKSLEKKMEKFQKALQSIPKGEQSAELYAEKIENTKISIAKTEVELKMETEAYTSILNDIDFVLDHIQELKVEIDKERSKINKSSINVLVNTLKDTLQRVEKPQFATANFNCTKEEFESLMVFYKTIQQKLQDIYEYGQSVVSESMQLIIENKDASEYASRCIAKIEENEDKERAMILDKIILEYKNVQVDCKLECPLKSLQKEILQYQKADTPTKYPKSFYLDMKLVYHSLKYIMNDLMSVGELVAKLPAKLQEELTIKKIMDRIKDTKLIYPEKMMNAFLSEITEYSLWKDTKEKLEDAKKELHNMEDLSKVPFYEKELEKEIQKKNTLDNKREMHQSKMKALEDKLNTLKHTMSTYETTHDALCDTESLQLEIDTLHAAKIKSESMEIELDDCNRKVNKTVEWLNQLKPNLMRLETNLDRYYTITHELDSLTKKRDEISLIMYALSNREGIPLYHIKNYLNGTRILANQLLDIVYDGKIRLAEFDIDENVFAMPYIKDGQVIEDVSLASQGEKSFFNMAISSALRAQGLTKYNIALFDEPDGAFDDSNRQKFIPVLEKQLEVNKIEQAFLITHNMMFAKYPVDTIDMGDLENSSVDILAY